MDKLEKIFNIKPVEQEIAELPRKTIKAIANDPEKSAEIIHLRYVSDTQAGISRVKRGKTFRYLMNNKEMTDETQLKRIKRLAIPPAWTNVWICSVDNGHLQATGLDAKKRKQYRYHPWWNALRNQTKFFRLYEFGKALPLMRKQIEKDLAREGMPLEKILATVISLMERTTIRVGNSTYEKLYGSFGMTTLKNKHVSINGSNIKFTFKGKKGIHHTVNLKSRRLANIVRQCKEIPGKELFEYYDSDGIIHSIDSGMVNDYIKNISGGDYTSKDFRTWAGTLKALLTFKEMDPVETETEVKRKISEVLDIVSAHLGNTRNICKKYYVHPAILSLYEKNGLKNYLGELEKTEKEDDAGVTPEEKILMKILQSNNI